MRLHLERVLNAPRDRVFAACVEPDQLASWWGPAGFTTPRVDLDAREGGLYRITMQPPEGDAFHLRGQFTRIDAPQCLVYTFEWEEPDPEDRETLVTLSFRDDRDGTRLVLDQGVFATRARYDLHEAGWTETLDRLAAHLQQATSLEVMESEWTVERHLLDKPDDVVALYHRFIGLVGACGPFTYSVTKTAITLKGSRRGFAGLKPRKASLDGYLDLERRVEDSRIRRSGPYTKRLFVHHFRIVALPELDAEFAGWLREAYAVGAGAHLDASKGR